MSSGFQDDLAEDLSDPEFLRRYVIESVRISTVDAIINALNDARVEADLSKADIARAIGAEPAIVRRFCPQAAPTPPSGRWRRLPQPSACRSPFNR